ncbi:hypothetical protein Tco_0004191 [Tanacetum coccineum]
MYEAVFWSTVKAKTINGEVQLHALVDGKKIIITESTVRRDLQIEDVEGVDCLPNSTIFEQLTLMVSKTTAWNEFSSTMASAIICLATNQKFNFSKYIFESMIRNLDNLSGKFLMYPSESYDNDADEVVQKRVGWQFGKVGGAATTASSNRSRAGSSGNTLRSDEDRLKLDELMALCTTLQNRVLDLEKTKTTQQNEIASFGKDDDADKEMFNVDALNSEEVFVAGQNENVVEEVVDAAQPGKSTTTTTTISSQQSQDKGKGRLIEPVKPVKKKDLIRLDEEVALKLQDEFHEEERLARENVKKEKEANIALIETWDNIQAKIDADHQLAERLQA